MKYRKKKLKGKFEFLSSCSFKNIIYNKFQKVREREKETETSIMIENHGMAVSCPSPQFGHMPSMGIEL